MDAENRYRYPFARNSGNLDYDVSSPISVILNRDH